MSSRGIDLIDEELAEIPETFRGFSYLCEFCDHGKRVHRAEGCRPTGRPCPMGCKRFLPA